MKVRPLRQLNKLIRGKTYLVIGIEADSYRIVDEIGKPYLYEPTDFQIIDSIAPQFWNCEIGDDGEQYCYTKEWSEPGFFEDYFDGLVEAKTMFRLVMESKYAL